LRANAHVIEATELRTAINVLTSCIASTKPSAVLVTDVAILEPNRKGLATKLAEYARAGGTVVFGGMFPSEANPPKYNAFFNKIWGVNWSFGSYTSADTALNRSVTSADRLRIGEGVLSESYHMKAVHVRGAGRDASVYLEKEEPDESDSEHGSHTFQRQEETPVAFSKFGTGYLGFLGDVNPGENATKVIVAMCGLS